jgi:hypothetical protein
MVAAPGGALSRPGALALGKRHPGTPAPMREQCRPGQSVVDVRVLTSSLSAVAGTKGTFFTTFSPCPRPRPPRHASASPSHFALPRSHSRACTTLQRVLLLVVPLLLDCHHDYDLENSSHARLHQRRQILPTDARNRRDQQFINQLEQSNLRTQVDQAIALIGSVDSSDPDRTLDSRTYTHPSLGLVDHSAIWYDAPRVTKVIQEEMDKTNMYKVLFKRKPVGLIPQPLNIKDDAEVCVKCTRDHAPGH